MIPRNMQNTNPNSVAALARSPAAWAADPSLQTVVRFPGEAHSLIELRRSGAVRVRRVQESQKAHRTYQRAIITALKNFRWLERAVCAIFISSIPNGIGWLRYARLNQ